MSKNKRSRSKYPALEKNLNLKSRSDYIEPDYINGVYDSEGNMLIRPLDESEKKWLNQYYEETVNTNFTHNKDLKELSKLKKSLIEDDLVKELQEIKKELKLEYNNNPNKLSKKRLNKIISDIRKLKNYNKENYLVELVKIEEEMQKIRNETLFYPNKEQHKEFYDANNARNSDIFLNRKSRGMLISLDPQEYDKFYSNEGVYDDDETPWETLENLYNRSND